MSFCIAFIPFIYPRLRAYYKNKSGKAIIRKFESIQPISWLTPALVVHLIHSSSLKIELAGFCERLAKHKTDLIMLLSQQTALISASNRTDIMRIDKNVQALVNFFVDLVDEQESQAIAFIDRHGGDEAVQCVSSYSSSSTRFHHLNSPISRTTASLNSSHLNSMSFWRRI